LGTWEQCIAMVEDIRVDRFEVDEFMNAFVRVFGKKKKKKVIWRSIDDEWMSTKRD
jgi:lipoate-protein ligase A